MKRSLVHLHHISRAPQNNGLTRFYVLMHVSRVLLECRRIYHGRGWVYSSLVGLWSQNKSNISRPKFLRFTK